MINLLPNMPAPRSQLSNSE